MTVTPATGGGDAVTKITANGLGGWAQVTFVNFFLKQFAR